MLSVGRAGASGDSSSFATDSPWRPGLDSRVQRVCALLKSAERVGRFGREIALSRVVREGADSAGVGIGGGRDEGEGGVRRRPGSRSTIFLGWLGWLFEMVVWFCLGWRGIVGKIVEYWVVHDLIYLSRVLCFVFCDATSMCVRGVSGSY